MMKSLFQKIPTMVWFAIPTLILIIGGVWFLSTSDFTKGEPKSAEAVPVSDPVEGVSDLDIVSDTHIASGTEGTGYNTNPPTSGPHWGAAAKNGIYDKELPDEQLIHNLEHGHVWISYKPDLNEEAVKQLEEIVREDAWKVVITPRAENDSRIALASWGRLLKMDEPDYEKVRDFIKTYRNRGPENTPE